MPVTASKRTRSDVPVSVRSGPPRPLLSTLDTKARDDLRRVLIRNQADRDAISSDLLRHRDERGDGWAGHHRHADDATGGAAAGRETVG